MLIASTAHPQANKSDETLDQYKSLFAEQQKEFEKQRQIILEQGKEIEKLKNRLDALSKQPAGVAKKDEEPAAKTPSKSVATQPTVKRTEQASSQAEPSNIPSGPVGQAPPDKDEKPRPPEMPRLSDTVGGVLTRKGKIILEPALEYSFTDSNRLFLYELRANF
jgi:hypothetical protein